MRQVLGHEPGAEITPPSVADGHRLVQKAFAMHRPTGQGHVIAFAEDANYRSFSEATMLLFMNAVLLGPGY